MSMQQSRPPRSSLACRVFACVLALAALSAPGPPLGAQAPVGAASIDGILKELSTYDGGIGSEAVWKLRDYVNARKDDAAGRAECEAKILQFL